MMRYGVGFTVSEIFLTHMHADHYLGTVGLLRTMSLQDREEPLGIHTPPGGDEILGQAVGLELDDLTFPVLIGPLEPGESVRRSDYSISAYAVNHAGGANGYVLKEDERPGRFYPERAQELGVPEGPLFGQLQRGETVELEGRRTVRPEQVMGPARPGRTVVYTGDTRPCDTTIEVAGGCDMLVHEATFSDDEVDRAGRTGHSTARQAGDSERPYVLEREAKRACGGSCEVIVAYDGLTIEIPLQD